MFNSIGRWISRLKRSKADNIQLNHKNNIPEKEKLKGKLPPLKWKKYRRKTRKGITRGMKIDSTVYGTGPGMKLRVWKSFGNFSKIKPIYGVLQ